MGSGVVQALYGGGEQGRDAAAHQDGDGGGKADKDGHPHLFGADFFAQVFGGAPHHQSGDEDGEQRKADHAVQAAAYAAEDDFAQLHLEHGHHAADGGIAVVHRVDRPIGCSGGKGRPGGGGGDAEAGLLALHVAADVAFPGGRCQPLPFCASWGVPLFACAR